MIRHRRLLLCGANQLVAELIPSRKVTPRGWAAASVWCEPTGIRVGACVEDSLVWILQHPLVWIVGVVVMVVVGLIILLYASFDLFCAPTAGPADRVRHAKRNLK
jgi:hypothetical protein